MDKEVLLKKQDVLKDLPHDLIKKLSDHAQHGTFKQGDILMHAGDESDKLYFIIRGVVFIHAHTRDGVIIPVNLLYPGQTVGEMGVLRQKERSASVEALSDVDVLYIRADDFTKLIRETPELSTNFIKDLSQRIERNDYSMKIMKTRNIVERTRLLLQELSEGFPGNTIPLSHEKIAEVVGVTRPRLTEALHELQKEGYLSLAPNRITLHMG